MPTEAQLEDAKGTVAWYTLAASATGAVPLPAASAAVIAETGAMLAHVSSRLGIEIGWANLLESLGLAASLNVLGRSLFIEGAKLLGWGTGNVWAAVCERPSGTEGNAT